MRHRSRFAIALTLGLMCVSLSCNASPARYHYDALGRLTRHVDAQDGASDYHYVYDAAGNVLPRTTPGMPSLRVAAAPSAAIASTQIDFISDPGDFIGGGQTFSLTPADGAIIVNPSANGIYIRYNGTSFVPPKTFWSLSLMPVEGGLLRPGNFPSAQRSPFQSPKRPGLDISGDGRGCNQLTGIFTVFEVLRDADGAIISFAADAEQHCEGSTPALRTRIRFNSTIPMIVPAPQSVPGLPQEVYERTLVRLDGSWSYAPAGQIVAWEWAQVSGPPITIESPSTAVTLFRAPEVAPGGADVVLQLDVADASGNNATGTVTVHVFDRRDRRTWLTWRSPVGDYIGGGEPLAFSLADGDAALAGYDSLSSVQTHFVGDAFNDWHLQFAAAGSGILAPGVYLDAQRYPFQAAGHPGLDVYGSGRGCNSLSGQFTVLEYEPAANLSRFAARFVQSCEDFMPPLRGTVLFNGVAPGSPVARVATPPIVPPGAVVALDGTGSSSTGSALVAYRWRQTAGPFVITSDPNRATLYYTVPASSGSLMRFELEVMDEDGLVDFANVAPTTLALLPRIPGGLASPVFLTHAADGSNRLFIVEQGGVVRVLQPGQSAATVFLDIQSRVLSGGERGLLGLAFHPKFATNGRFFVYYTRNTDGAIVISEYGVSPKSNVAGSTGANILRIAHPDNTNHNGGMIAFGPDGYLYIGVGDGGSSNDPPNNAQNPNVLLGKILRIDVDHPDIVAGTKYSSPPDNPFVGGGGRPEIFSLGWRNPWRFSFDRTTGRQWVGDVGQDAVEEVDTPIVKGGNYGWRVFEGAQCTGNDPALCNPVTYLPPLFAYPHSNGRCAITGGYVYRGALGTFPSGTYVYGDFCTGEVLTWDGEEQRAMLDTGLSIASFGEDEQGELYVVDLGGTVSRITSSTPSAPTLASVKSRKAHGAAGTFDLTLAASLVAPSTEPRTGPSHTIVFTFDKPVTSGAASVTEGVATAGVPTFEGADIIVPLTGVTNQQYVTVVVSNVSAEDGSTGGNGSIRVGFLFGDVNQSRSVTLSDLGQVNAQIAQSVTATNFLVDINASGTLSLADKALVNAQITKALPAP